MHMHRPLCLRCNQPWAQDGQRGQKNDGFQNGNTGEVSPDTEFETMEEDRRPRNGCSCMHVDPKQDVGGEPDDHERT